VALIYGPCFKIDIDVSLIKRRYFGSGNAVLNSEQCASTWFC